MKRKVFVSRVFGFDSAEAAMKDIELQIKEYEMGAFAESLIISIRITESMAYQGQWHAVALVEFK